MIPVNPVNALINLWLIFHENLSLYQRIETLKYVEHFPNVSNGHYQIRSPFPLEVEKKSQFYFEL